jgi:hypothetical protein
MRIRLGYALELVLVLAVGMALARWSAHSMVAAGYYRSGVVRQFQLFAEPFLAGAALAGGLGTWLEAARRRSPPIWGIGRWSWSVTALTVLLYSAVESTVQMAVRWKKFGHPDVKAALGQVQGQCILTMFYPQTCWVLAAAWLTSRICGQPRDLAPDAREWAGRVFLALVVMWGIAYNVFAVIISN